MRKSIRLTLEVDKIKLGATAKIKLYGYLCKLIDGEECTDEELMRLIKKFYPRRGFIKRGY